MAEPADELARETIQFGLRLGELLLRSGAGTREVEASLIAVITALGLSDIEVDITSQSILLQHAPPGRPPMVAVRVCRTESRDHSRLVAAHRLVADLAGGRCTRAEARIRLDEIETSHKPWPRWMVSVAYGVLAAAVCVVVGGGPKAMVMALATSIVLDRLGRMLARAGVQPFFVTFIGSTAASVMTVLAVRAELLSIRDASAVIAGGIVVLLPGRLLVSTFEDAINGFPVTASGRMLSVMLTGAAIISGVAVGLGLARRMDIVLQVDVAGGSATKVWVGVIAAGVASLSSAITHRTRLALLIPAVTVGVVGYATFQALVANGFASRVTATAVAAVVIGIGGSLWASWLKAPSIVISVPALVFLLPGLTIFMAMSQITQDTNQGLQTLFLALGTALAIGAGVAFGEVLADPGRRALPRSADTRPRSRPA
jgi:uncharacterized membrane protein YjjP (DUF1212 family)